MATSKGDSTRTLHARAAVAPPLPVLVRVVGPSGPVAAGPSGAPAPPRPEPVLLERGTVTVGAASACDLVLDDPAVSRRHVELELAPEGVFVRDLGSRNGTFYLGQRVHRMVVTPGALLQVGSTTLAIELDRRALAADAPLGLAGFRGMVGSSPSMQTLFTRVARLDGSLLPVLLTGETGAGKELVARALHEGSRVADGPFVAVNCGSLARELVASTLFGHKKGAFTGATDARKGAFGAAEGGTLLLDEVGELPLELQPALLRALETGDVVPVGEDVPRQVTVRVIAATNRDLEAEVRAGRFREDLYYRLAVVTLGVPTLRERPDDVPLLAELFARQEGAPGLPADVLEDLGRRPWPGNVRELRNAVRGWVALGQVNESRRPTEVEPGLDKALEAAVRLDVPFLDQREAIAERFTALYVERLMTEARGNQTAAAKMAGLDRTYLGRLLAKLGRR